MEGRRGRAPDREKEKKAKAKGEKKENSRKRDASGGLVDA